MQAAEAAGLARDGGLEALADDLIGAVIDQVRPVRPNGHGAAWETLLSRRQDVTGWVGQGLSIVTIGELLTRSGNADSTTATLGC